MEAAKKQVDVFLDGFFFLFGFMDNPISKTTKEIMEKSPAEKIKGDLKKVNADYRKKFDEMRKEVMCLES